jgi:hypothetical protein
MPVEKNKVVSGLTAMARRGVHIKCSAFLETIGSSRRSLSIRLLARRPLVHTDAADMLKRRLKQAGLPAHYSPHSFPGDRHHEFS